MKYFALVFIISFSLLYPLIAQENPPPKIKSNSTEWTISRLLNQKTDSVKVLGSPTIVSTKYGKAVEFNGKNDAIFIDKMALAGLEVFTVEMIFNPYSGGNFEQRIFHCGEITNSRVLLELRSVPKGWYFDAFIKAGTERHTLIDSTLVHPHNQWYHVAFVVNHGQLTTYINGIKELEAKINMSAFFTGRTSIGVRQTENSWFRGMIYKIKITPKVLSPRQFMKHQAPFRSIKLLKI
jgi:hypothetical protein